MAQCFQHRNLLHIMLTVSSLHRGLAFASRRTIIQRTTSQLAATTNLEISTAEDMEDMAGLLATFVIRQNNAVILLDGDLGAGKTTFARGFLRTATGDDGLRVTSPTYLLSNTYLTIHGEIHHMDLYRLSGEDDLGPLNLHHVFANCISLIEWPVRLGSRAPSERLEVTITIPDDIQEEDDLDNEWTRRVQLTPKGEAWENILSEIVDSGAIDDLLC